MSDTQDAARRLRRCRRRRGGILDCRCARRSANRAGRDEGMVISDRTKGCCSSDLNEPRTLTMTDLLNLTHTTHRSPAAFPDGIFSVNFRAGNTLKCLEIVQFFEIPSEH